MEKRSKCHGHLKCLQILELSFVNCAHVHNLYVYQITFNEGGDVRLGRKVTLDTLQ